MGCQGWGGEGEKGARRVREGHLQEQQKLGVARVNKLLQTCLY